MNKKEESILKHFGWEVECESPFEIRNKHDGGFATNSAAYMILFHLTRVRKKEKAKRSSKTKR